MATITPDAFCTLPIAEAAESKGRPGRLSGLVSSLSSRVVVDGKFFRLGNAKFFPKGVTYGPFSPNSGGEPFAGYDRTRDDFGLLRELGANFIRVYDIPPRWLLNLALENGLRVFVDVPWNKHLCFLDSEEYLADARGAVRKAAIACKDHAAVFAISVVNEVPPDIVRWSNAKQVSAFIDELVREVRQLDPAILCTFGNFPSTEFLRPEEVDFLCFNVYLHEQVPFENYLARLQMLAENKPLMIGEFGVDTIREGEVRQSEILVWKIESACRFGCAGVAVYSFSDEWYKDGRLVGDWAFGLTRADRQKKISFEAVARAFDVAPYFPLKASPKVSVVVASYNGAATLRTCLQSLEKLNYPSYEVILVDDGSTDGSAEIARDFPAVSHIRHPENLGLSAARNTGIEAARGEIIAFTDSDCRADPDWLYYLVGDLIRFGYTGIGGHNFLPPDDSATAAAVMVSPGGPAHVMLTDRLAEHLPGCNMAFYKWALVSVGGFDATFRRAGDDVDICWRLQQRGCRLGFSPGGFVWHYRRNTIQAYLRQQSGYGEAEAMLERRHPENFNGFGGSIWHGRIYSPAKIGVHTRPPIIYHGIFGSAPFQSIYTPSAGLTLVVATSIEYHVLVTLPLMVLSAVLPYVGTLGVASFLFSVGLCIAAGMQAEIPKNKQRVWSRPLVALLFLLQPIVRGWARNRGHFLGNRTPLSARETLESLSIEARHERTDELLYWSETGFDRMIYLARVLERLDAGGWQNKPDAGWSPYDVEVYGSRWATLRLVTATEYHRGGRQMLRCRLNASWSFLGRATFWVVVGLELVVISFLGKLLGNWGSMVWLLLLLLPPLAWRLNAAKRDLRRVMVAFLDERAKEFKLVRVDTR